MYQMIALTLLFLLACNEAPRRTFYGLPEKQPAIVNEMDTIVPVPGVFNPQNGIKTGNTDPAALISFSQTLKGVPYKYASTDPAVGFDCSGFITYVFNHFGIGVPRTSVDFTHEGTPVDLAASKPGDLILFTGTDSTTRIVGHMGIIVQTGDSVVFIHSTSGKAHGVTETTLNPYYMGRFMKVIRVFGN